MITLSSIQFRYRDGGFRLEVPSLTVQAGETVAVIGASGSGKTTLVHLVAGILRPTSGRVVTHGIEVSSLGDPARRNFRVRSVGLVFQEFELLEHLNVVDNVLLPCRINAAVPLTAATRERAAALAADVGLGDKLSRNIRMLSQGERQRVALCRALLLEPPVLLCDEPTGNLDPDSASTVLDLLFEQVRRSGTTLLTVTHDHDVLGRFDRTIDMKMFHASGEVSRDA
jgi:putative ABC transport system ATP-binding protein